MAFGTGRDIIVIGASAGGIEAISALMAALPAGLPAAYADAPGAAPDPSDRSDQSDPSDRPRGLLS
jgi:hypothetical protein